MGTPRTKYLRPEEITPAFLAGMANEAAPRNIALLNLATREAKPYNEAMPEGGAMRKAIITPADRRASVVAFGEHGKRIGDDKYVMTLVEPFHLATEKELDLRNPGVEMASDGSLTATNEAVAYAVMELGRAHTTSMVEALASMLGYSSYAYTDNPDPLKAEKQFNLSWSDEILALPAVGSYGALSSGTFSSVDASALAEYRMMRAEYRKAINEEPTMMLISSVTAAYMGKVKEIKAAYTPLSSSDPDNRAGTRGSFMFDGILHVVLADYIWRNGALVPAIPDGVGILCYQSASDDGGSAIRYLSCANKRNGKDGSAPVFGQYVAGAARDPLSKLIISSYDNIIPTPHKKGAIQRVQLY